MPMPPWAEVVARLILGAIFSGIIGWEREAYPRPAGLRTHMLVGLGATLVMLVSTDMINVGISGAADPGRIAAQVVSGIGFLGAGTILREGFTVRGLTTAASLWLVAAIGLATGAGLYTGAAVTTGVALAILTVLQTFESRLGGGWRLKEINMVVPDRPGQVGAVGGVLGTYRANIRHMELNPASEADHVEIRLAIDMPRPVDPTKLAHELSRATGASALRIE